MRTEHLSSFSRVLFRSFLDAMQEAEQNEDGGDYCAFMRAVAIEACTRWQSAAALSFDLPPLDIDDSSAKRLCEGYIEAKADLHAAMARLLATAPDEHDGRMAVLRALTGDIDLLLLQLRLHLLRGAKRPSRLVDTDRHRP